MTIEYIKGDLFDAPSGTILGHSCNCQGRWGSGVAAVFRRYYPNGYRLYNEHCLQFSSEEDKREKLLGTCLLIPPQVGDKKNNYIACLFTSCSFGGEVDSPEEIVKATESAINDLIKQIERLGINQSSIYIPKINAGLFRVPWENTAAVLEKSNYNFIVYEL